MSWNGFTQAWLDARTPHQPATDTAGGQIARPGQNLVAKTGVPAPATTRAKHGNTPTMRQGIRFDSKLEADYYDYLRFLVAGGEVSYFLRQVPLELPAGVTYRVDFLVFFPDGFHEYHEVKGHVTDVARIKMAQAQALYPITLRVIRRGDFPRLAP